MIDIKEKVADCLVRAGSTFREDQKEAYRKAIAEEQIESSCWVMKQVLDNALMAEKNHSPLCDDTGIPHRRWAERVMMRAKAYGVIDNEAEYINLFGV